MKVPCHSYIRNFKFFTSFYDDYWVADNIRKIESQVLVEVNIMYDSFRD